MAHPARVQSLRARLTQALRCGLRRHAVLPAALGLGLALASGTAAAEWRRFDSDHFSLYTERDARVANDLLRELEHLHWLGERYVGTDGLAPGAQSRFTVYELRGPKALQELYSGLHERTAGVYTICAEGIAAYTVQGGPDGDPRGGLTSWGQTVLQHEYAHHLMFSRVAAGYPAWFVEGFAEFLSQTAERSDELVFGGFNTWRSGRGSMSLAVERVLAWQRESAAGRERDIGDFYSKAWLLTHYLLSDDAHAARLNPYFARLARGEDPVAGFEAEFGLAPAALERALTKHVTRLPELSLPLSALPAVQTRAVPLPPDAQHYLLDESRLQTCIHHDKTLGPAVLERLRSVAAAPASSAGARRAAARAELLLGDLQAAARLLEPLVEQQADDADAHYLLGRVRARQADALAGDAQRDARAKARASLLQAYRLRKNDAPTLYALALALLREGVDRNGTNAARGARRLAPAVHEYAELAMRVELQAGDRAAAERALAPLTINAHASASAERARRAIDAVRAGRGADEVAALLRERPRSDAAEPAKPTEPEPTPPARP